jgi:hemoglobin
MTMLRTFAIAATAALMLSTFAARADDALFTDLGGRTGIATIVDDATANFLADPRIKDTFDNTNMDRFKTNLTDQLCVVAGGPCDYKGQTMHDAHKGLHLTNADFNALVEDLQAGMDKAGIAFSTQNRLLARLAPMQHDVVTK